MKQMDPGGGVHTGEKLESRSLGCSCCAGYVIYVAQISTGSDTGCTAIDLANEFFPGPIRKEDREELH